MIDVEALQALIHDAVDTDYNYVKINLCEDGQFRDVDIDATLTIEQLEQLVEILKHGT